MPVSRLTGLLKRLLHAALTPLLVALLLFEEWGWEPLARLAARLNRLPVWAALERWIAGLPPYAALAMFCTPALALFPLKLLALYWVGQGHVAAGLAVILGAKVVGTAMVARLFQLTQPALMRLAWFAHGYGRWKTFKDGLLAQVRASRAWRSARALRRLLHRWALAGWQGLRGRP